jgi:hypothetical protein
MKRIPIFDNGEPKVLNIKKTNIAAHCGYSYPNQKF